MKPEANKSAVTLTVLMLGCGVAHAAEPDAHGVPQRLK
jgi:hypothetical protein